MCPEQVVLVRFATLGATPHCGLITVAGALANRARRCWGPRPALVSIAAVKYILLESKKQEPVYTLTVTT